MLTHLGNLTRNQKRQGETHLPHTPTPLSPHPPNHPHTPTHPHTHRGCIHILPTFDKKLQVYLNVNPSLTLALTPTAREKHREWRPTHPHTHRGLYTLLPSFDKMLQLYLTLKPSPNLHPNPDRLGKPSGTEISCGFSVK